MVTLNNVLTFRLRQYVEQNGNLLPIEFDKTIPFKPKRTFFVCNVPDQQIRGCHAHYKTKQLIICLNGEITVKLHDGNNARSYVLTSGDAIYIPNLIWDEQIYHSIDTVLVSLCSTHYDTDDYIHNFDEFVKLKKNKK
jgi:UDP-2-acetamido-3-amino-2,3-dideoxy-glucuronate N-acetyltransferase